MGMSNIQKEQIKVLKISKSKRSNGRLTDKIYNKN